VCVYSLNVRTTPEILRPLGDTIGIYTSLLKENTWTTWYFWFPQWSVLRSQSANMWHSRVWEGTLGTRYCHLLLHTEAARTLFFLILVPTYQNMWCHIPEQCNHDSCQSSTTGHHESFAHTHIHTAHHTVTTRGNNFYDKTIFTPFFSYRETLLQMWQYLGIYIYRQVLFYTRVTSLIMPRISNTNFPFKTLYFLGVRGFDNLILHSDYATSGHKDL